MYPCTCIGFFANPETLIVLVYSTVFFVQLFTAALNSQFCALITMPSGWGFQSCLWGLKARFSIIINEIWVSKTPGQLWIHHLHLLGFISALRLSEDKAIKLTWDDRMLCSLDARRTSFCVKWPELALLYLKGNVVGLVKDEQTSWGPYQVHLVFIPKIVD